jgi:hypothetical protein
MNLIYLGCSLSAQLGKAEQLAKLLDLNLINLAVSAGSNPLAVRRFQEYVLRNPIHPSDIVVWQLTWAHRPYTRLLSRKLKTVMDSQPPGCYLYESVNIFDNLKRIDLLCNSPMQESHDDDPENQLEILLSQLILLHRTHPKIFVYPGANSIIPPGQTKTTFYNLLDKHAIPHLKSGYLDWVMENRLLLRDEYHPAEESGQQYATEVLYPILQSFQN